MPILRGRKLLQYRRERPAEPDGIFFRDPETGREIFMTFDELKWNCEMMMDAPRGVQAEYGKIDFYLDPTYNLRRK